MTTVDTSTSSNILKNYINTYQTKTTDTSTTTTSSDSKTLTADMNTFLTILTTQLKNQDPTSATDTNQFTQELVQFAGVEQQIQTNDNLKSLISIASPNGVTPVLNYVGKTAEADAGGKIAVQDGVGNFSYTLPETAQTATITIKNAAGKTVATVAGATASGDHKISWTAKDSSGNTLDDGTYTVSLVAKDSSGDVITTSTPNMIGVVTSVQTDSDGTATLSIGDVSFSASKVVAVYSGVTADNSAA